MSKREIKEFLQYLGDVTVRSDIKGRLLTTDEGCGLSKVPKNNRIVGGAPAKNGQSIKSDPKSDRISF